MRGPAACVDRRSVDTLDRESGSFDADRLGKDILERRHARPKMTDLHVRRGRERKELARPRISRHEDAHHVFLRRLALEPGGPQALDERFRTVWRLHAQFEHLTARLLERGYRA